MKATRFLIAALAACLVTVWTCPAYCSSLSAHSPKAPASVEMAGHEHHHMSEMSIPLDGPALMAIHGDCCEHCGDVDQALGLGEKLCSTFTSRTPFATLAAPWAPEGFALAAIVVTSPPLLEDTSPTSRSASPLRI